MKNIVILLLFAAITVAYGQHSKDDILKELQKKYNNINSVELTFAAEGNPDNQGIVKAKKGNKYYVRMPIMTVICNGKNVWNINEKDKKVILSDFDAKAQRTFSIDKFFFSFLNDYMPDKMTKENSSSGKNTYAVSFIPKDKSKSNMLKYFKLWLNRNTLDIIAVEIDHNSSILKFNLKNIKTNIKLTDKFFNFQPPKNFEVIDAR